MLALPYALIVMLKCAVVIRLHIKLVVYFLMPHKSVIECFFDSDQIPT